MIKKIAARVLPERAYGTGRQLVRKYRRYKHQGRPKLSESDFCKILTRDLEVREGAVVFVHSSIDQMNLDFPFYRVLSTLRDLVGKSGTMLFPTSQLSERPEDWLRREEVFDVGKTPTTMGVIAEFARRQKGAVRSLHPTNSVVALGNRARELVEDHPRSIYPCDQHSPFYKIVHYDGLIIGLGVSTEVLTFVHCVEDNLRERFPVETRRRELYAGRVLDENGCEQIVKTLVAHKRIRWRRVSRYMRRHVPEDMCRDLKIDGVNYYTAQSRALYAKMEELAMRNITIYSRLVYTTRPFAHLSG